MTSRGQGVGVSTAVMSLGSNLGDRFGYLRLAVHGFAAELVAASPVYETAPWGGVEQPDFLNAVLIVAAPDHHEWDWLRRAKALEAEAGRVREVRWGPRTLDIDVVTVYGPDGPVHSEHPDLLLPHPGAAMRNTVLRPWLDIDAAAELPGRGPVAALLAALPDPDAGLRRLDDLTLSPPGGQR